MALNELITSLIDSIQTARDDWETESGVEQADLTPSAMDTNILIAAITQGSGKTTNYPLLWRRRPRLVFISDYEISEGMQAKF